MSAEKAAYNPLTPSPPLPPTPPALTESLKGLHRSRLFPNSTEASCLPDMLRSSQASRRRPSFLYPDRGPVSHICVQPSHGLNWREVRKQSSSEAGGRRKETTQGRWKIEEEDENVEGTDERMIVELQSGLTCTLFGGPLISQLQVGDVS